MSRMIEMLIDLLEQAKDKNAKAIILQSYISAFGPLPNEYGDVIRELLRGEDDEADRC